MVKGHLHHVVTSAIPRKLHSPVVTPLVQPVETIPAVFKVHVLFSSTLTTTKSPSCFSAQIISKTFLLFLLHFLPIIIQSPKPFRNHFLHLFTLSDTSYLFLLFLYIITNNPFEISMLCLPNLVVLILFLLPRGIRRRKKIRKEWRGLWRSSPVKHYWN